MKYLFVYFICLSKNGYTFNTVTILFINIIMIKDYIVYLCGSGEEDENGLYSPTNHWCELEREKVREQKRSKLNIK